MSAESKAMMRPNTPAEAALLALFDDVNSSMDIRSPFPSLSVHEAYNRFLAKNMDLITEIAAHRHVAGILAKQ